MELEHLSKQAKALRADYQAQKPDAEARIRKVHPRLAQSLDDVIFSAQFQLSDAQLVIAREYGFDCWPRLKAHVLQLARPDDEVPPTIHEHVRAFEPFVQRIGPIEESLPLVAWLQHQADVLRDAHRAKEVSVLTPIKFGFPPLLRRSDEEILAATFADDDARLTIAKTYWFDSWDDVIAHQNRVVVSMFERAVDMIVGGEVDALRSLLEQHSDLTRARSAYGHQSTLLHYVSANGVEIMRQKTPQNILAVTKLLLQAGAEVDAESQSYGGGPNQTTLCLTLAARPKGSRTSFRVQTRARCNHSIPN